jgi:hypothetical protein
MVSAGYGEVCVARVSDRRVCCAGYPDPVISPKSLRGGYQQLLEPERSRKKAPKSQNNPKKEKSTPRTRKNDKKIKFIPQTQYLSSLLLCNKYLLLLSVTHLFLLSLLPSM